MGWPRLARELLSLTLLAPPLAALQASLPLPAQTPALPQVHLGNLPVTFEANQGQAAPEVKFLSRGLGYKALLTAEGMVLGLRPAQIPQASGSGSSALSGQGQDQTRLSQTKASSVTIQMKLLGANPNATAVGEGLQPGKVNYFIGNDPSQWHTNVPTYQAVRYQNVYPGIDLLYYGNHRQIEYDFVIASGGDPGKIQIEIAGTSAIRIDQQGNLVLQLPNSELSFHAPMVYQESPAGHVAISSSYIILDSNHITFRVAPYDHTKQLVIDPSVIYSTYLGGSGDDQPNGIAVDSSGDLYVAGYTDSTDFPLATIGALPAGDHVFVAKLDPTGSNLLYADYIGGNDQDYGFALALDSANNVYVTGSTASSNFPLVNPFQSQYPGSYNGFLSEVSPDGSSLLYSTYLGGNGSDQPSSIAIDHSGDIVVSGNTSSTDFPVANPYQGTVLANGGDVFGTYGFVTTFAPGGASLVYSTYLGGNTNVALNCGGSPCWPAPSSTINSLALDASGNAYVAGVTNTYNFPTTSGAYLTTDSIGQNGMVGFVSKFNAAGGLDYSTYFYEASGVLSDLNAIAVDAAGEAFVTGAAYSDGTFPVTATSICNPLVSGTACGYAFVTKFNASASALLYSTFLGANNSATPWGILLDSSNDAYILASTSSSSFTTTGAIQPYAGGADLLLVEIDPLAGSQLFSTYLGGSADDYPSGAALAADDSVYLAGTTDSTDIPVTQGAVQPTFAGGTDAFLLKIGPPSQPAVILSPSQLQFAVQSIGIASAPQSFQLQNPGGASLAISSITATGDFAEADDCGGSLAPAGQCTLSVTFTPTADGVRNGTISLQDNALASPQVVSLSGTGDGGVASLSPDALSFPSVAVGGSSAPQSIVLSNTGNGPLSVSSAQISGPFSQTSNCGASLAVSSNCKFTVIFSPSSTGSLTGSIAISTGAQTTPVTISLIGVGADFTLAAASGSQTVSPGQTASYKLTISSLGGAFPDAIGIACSGAAAAPPCSLSPAQVSIGSASAVSTLTIATVAPSSSKANRRDPNKFLLAAWLQFSGLGLLGAVLLGRKPQNGDYRRLARWGFLLILLMTISMSGCAGGTGIEQPPQSGTPAGTYTFKVTATSGSLQHSLQATLVVQ